MKKLFWFITLLMFTSSLQATTESEEKIMALKVIKKYSQTVACRTSFEHEEKESLLKNIFTIKRDTKYGYATYYVLWSGDMGCMNGGAGTDSFYISEIHRDDSSKPFIVMNDEAFGKNFSEIGARFIDNIQQINAEHFLVVASSYGDDDPLCCPSLKYQYALSKSKKSIEWTITSKKQLK
jgi:hypothetical protein